jgi:hypothetical protein
VRAGEIGEKGVVWIDEWEARSMYRLLLTVADTQIWLPEKFRKIFLRPTHGMCKRQHLTQHVIVKGNGSTRAHTHTEHAR